MTLVCIASGPSLTSADCELVRLSGLETMAVNSSWKLAPFCNHIYAGDRKWWDAYGKEINIPAILWTCSKGVSIKFGINLHAVHGPYNSGMRAIQWGIEQKKKTIILLGYDCSVKNGIHWHGAHDKTRNPTDEKCLKWKNQFRQMATLSKVKKIKIINCSRETALTCFERMPLEIALEQFGIH